MRDQLSASGSGARARAGAQRLSAPAVTAEAQGPATVIATDPGLWRRFEPLPETPLGGVSKRAFDIAASSAAILVLSPVLALIWVGVRIEQRGAEAIFKQQRGGFAGKPFNIFKFRTMVCAEDGDDVQQVRRGDTRITKFGGFLRKTSLDELPQLFNVLRGEMSLVGPRPHPVALDLEFAQIDPDYARRVRATPGMTGLAQVSGARGPTETDEAVRNRVRFDLEYIAKWSFFGDIAIMIRTLGVFFRDENAL